MFVTLRATKKGSGIEQVQTLGPPDRKPGSRKAGSARGACRRCSIKKVRCTGPRDACDRCSSLSLPCIASVSARKPKSERRQGNDTASAKHQSQSSAAQASLPTPFYAEVSTPIQHDIDESTFTTPNWPLSFSSLLGDDTYQAALRSPLEPTSITRTSASNDLLGNAQPNSVNADPGPVSTSDQPSNHEKPYCSCTSQLFDVVQKLDDDFFHLANLTFDQCLQVQKWLVFKCCEPLNCSSCAGLSIIHSTMLIICERLTAIFCCLAVRLKRARPKDSLAQADPQTSPENAERDGISPGTVLEEGGGGGRKRLDFELIGDWYHLKPSAASEDSSLSSSEQLVQAASLLPMLFDSTSGKTGERVTGERVTCNPDMFKEEARHGYSPEEQLLMLQALITVRLRDFENLLGRVGDMEQTKQSMARKRKLVALKGRFHDARMVIEEALASLLQVLRA